MTPAATVLVCALELLHRSPASLPRIELLDVRPVHASVNAEAFVDPATATIYILTTSAVFRAAQLSETRCGNLDPIRKLASIIVHEEWHVRHGSDEEGAYYAQLTTLAMLGAIDTPIYHGVRRAMAAVLAQRRPAAQITAVRLKPDTTY
jgi:hypothetical protein